MHRVIFHRLVTLEEALSTLRKWWPKRREEVVDLLSAVGRVLSRDIEAPIDVPPFDRSTVDGYAVIAEDTYGAWDDRPVELQVIDKVEAGDWPRSEVVRGSAVEVATGAPIPRGSNAVVMVEYTRQIGDKVLVYRPVAPGENIMSAGSDVSAGETVLRRCTKLTPREIGTLAALGITKVPVVSPLRVAVISTGNEIVEPGTELGPGKLYDVNSYSIYSALAMDGAKPILLGVVPDDEDRLARIVEAAVELADVVLVSGGTSAGPSDITYRVLSRMGEILFHGIKIRPGKPTVAAVVRGKPVVGLPGYPSSALMIYHVLIRPLILEYNCERSRRLTIRAVLPIRIRGAQGRRTLQPVVVISRNGRPPVAYPLDAESGAISVLARADGIISIPEDVEYLDEGEEVEVELFREYEPARLYFVGSHDPLLDRVLADVGAKTIYVGSMGGLRALIRGEADMAGTHIYEDGEFNIPVLRKLGARNVALVRGFKREQGLIVARGNPKGITSVEDIAKRGDIVIVNRPRGSGTRALLDRLLQEAANRLGVDFNELVKRIRGYTYEVKTHTAVAAAVAQGRADVGIGVRYAAELYGLDFIPIGWEWYDLAVRRDLVDEAKRLIRQAMEMVQERGIRGYVFDGTSGEVIWESG